MAERKKFINVEIPILNKTIQVLGTPKDLENKTIKMDLSRQLRGKGLTITLQILNKDDILIAYPRKLELMKSYIRRIIRKRTNPVEDSFKTNTKDLAVTLKPLLITRKKVSRAVRKNLRNTAREFLITYAKEKTYLEFCEETLEGTIQKELLPKLKKVYPLAFCDIRIVETSEAKNITPEIPVKEEESPEVKQDKEETADKEEAKEEAKEEKPKAKKKATKKATKKKADEESKEETEKETEEDANKE
jgi:ribosomal protein S3AE